MADKPLYHAIPTNSIGEQGHLTYRVFDKVVKLNINQPVQGNNPQQIQFQGLLLRIKKANSTVSDWKLLLTRQPTNVGNLIEFKYAVRLFYGNEEVAKYNYEQLVKLKQPVAQIGARHSLAWAITIHKSQDLPCLKPG